MEKENKTTKEEMISNNIEAFIFYFHDSYKNDRNYDGKELTDFTDDNIKDILTKYFSFDSLTEANKYFYNALNDYVPDPYNTIDWGLEREKLELTPEFIEWRRHGRIEIALYDANRIAELEQGFVDIHGKIRTNEEAATLAADKWCELLFNWHLQDNGALNEDHPGGFTACALGTVLADNCRKNITEEMKVKARELFIQYYLHDIEYHSGDWRSVIKWAEKTLPDPDKDSPFEWSYGFGSTSMYCDYSPYMPLYLVLINAGIDDYDARTICPWKTGISIRALDNAVQYHTYQHCEDL